jgi:hypothetical protein
VPGILACHRGFVHRTPLTKGCVRFMDGVTLQNLKSTRILKIRLAGSSIMLIPVFWIRF